MASGVPFGGGFCVCSDWRCSGACRLAVFLDVPFGGVFSDVPFGGVLDVPFGVVLEGRS